MGVNPSRRLPASDSVTVSTARYDALLSAAGASAAKHAGPLGASDVEAV